LDLKPAAFDKGTTGSQTKKGLDYEHPDDMPPQQKVTIKD